MTTDANLLREDLAGILACTSQVSLVLSQARLPGHLYMTLMRGIVLQEAITVAGQDF